MPVMTGYDDGMPCWVDLGSSNIEESVQFYGSLFGWSHQDTGAEPANMSGAQLVNEPGTLVWNELNTRDIEASKAFYPKVFGWAAHDNAMEGMTYTEWQVSGRTIGGMLPMPEAVPTQVPNHWLVYFGTDDTDATVAKATELRGSVMAPPFDVPPGRTVTVFR